MGATTAAGYRAEARYRDSDGTARRVTAVGASRSTAKAALRGKFVARAASAGSADLGSESTLEELAVAWLADV